MLRLIKTIFRIAIFGFAITLSAQQESLFSHYNEVLEVFNPAVSGTQKGVEFTLLRRTQWSSIAMAPETYVFSMSLPTNKTVGLGLNIVQDKAFIEKSTFVGIDYSYKLKLNDDTNLYLGLKAGAHAYEVNPNSLETYNLVPDSSLEYFSKVLPNIGMGLYVTHKKLAISIATPRLLNTERVQEKEGRALFAKDRMHYYTSLDYQFEINQRTSFNAIAVTRFVQGAPMSFDFQGRFWYNNRVMLGGAYRTDQTLSVLAQLKLHKNFFIGWAYESLTNADLSNAGNSQELLLKITL